MTTETQRNYSQDHRERLATELEALVHGWRQANWWVRWTFAKQIFITVKHHLPTITQALRGGEGK